MGYERGEVIDRPAVDFLTKESRRDVQGNFMRSIAVAVKAAGDRAMPRETVS